MAAEMSDEQAPELIERCAKAARAAYGNWLGGWEDDSACPEYKREDWRNVARAVLAEMELSHTELDRQRGLISELLAKCWEREERWGGTAPIMSGEIRALLGDEDAS